VTNLSRIALLATALLALTACYPNDPDYNRCGEGGAHAPNDPPPNADCSFFDEQWELYSFFPRNATYYAAVRLSDDVSNLSRLSDVVAVTVP